MPWSGLVHNNITCAAASAMVVARPHFRQEGANLHFFLSDRVFHTLSSAESALWQQLLLGPVELQSVADSSVVAGLELKQIVEVIAPIVRLDKRTILVVEPHSDDAALSIGGTLWKLRHEVEFHVLTMASQSNYSSGFHLRRNSFDVRKITQMRTAEGELFVRHLGGQYHCAGLTEATLRYEDSDWDLTFFSAHEVSVAAGNNRRVATKVLEQWTDKIKTFLIGRHYDEIWIPLGAGTHGDHDAARNAALNVLIESRSFPVVRLYEDVPYGTQFHEHTKRILRELEVAGASLTPWFQDVTAEFGRKLQLLSIFASQFKVQSIKDGVERSASDGGVAAAQRIERLWTLKDLPAVVPADDIWIGAPEVTRARVEIVSFLQGSASARRVAIFAIGGAGRWRDDLDRLKEVFTKANFIVYAGPKVCAEFIAVSDSRVELRPLDGSVISWLKAALRETPTGHRIVISGDAAVKARQLSALWVVGNSLIVTEIDHLIQALETHVAL
jgi:LmbE family N-acetylglucosaminyl deacetylase